MAEDTRETIDRAAPLADDRLAPEIVKFRNRLNVTIAEADGWRRDPLSNLWFRVQDADPVPNVAIYSPPNYLSNLSLLWDFTFRNDYSLSVGAWSVKGIEIECRDSFDGWLALGIVAFRTVQALTLGIAEVLSACIEHRREAGHGISPQTVSEGG